MPYSRYMIYVNMCNNATLKEGDLPCSPTSEIQKWLKDKWLFIHIFQKEININNLDNPIEFQES